MELVGARADKRGNAYCLGIGLNTLTLTASVLTVVVVDDDLFDELFGDAVQINAEGVLVPLLSRRRCRRACRSQKSP